MIYEDGPRVQILYVIVSAIQKNIQMSIVEAPKSNKEEREEYRKVKSFHHEIKNDDVLSLYISTYYQCFKFLWLG